MRALYAANALFPKAMSLWPKTAGSGFDAGNSEERIVVEQLKGPERITSIAEKQLGMQVARNNIYVKADKGKIAYDGYAYAK